MEMVEVYTRVKLITNKYGLEGAFIGMYGYVIECYHDGKYELEFSNLDGVTIAQFVADEEDFIPAPELKG